MRRTVRFGGLGLLLSGLVAIAPANESVDRYNYILGTHTIGAHYQFTDKTRLVETAEVIQGMGSNILKFRFGPSFSKRNYAGPNPGQYDRLVDLAAHEPSFRAVFEMPFYYYFMWVAPMQPAKWGDADGFTRKDALITYREIYDFVTYLLKTYRGSGKHFYLGHWEGDWLLVRDYDAQMDPIPHRVENMIKWLIVRQKAVDDAKRDNPDTDVQVFHYCEVNQVMKGLKGQKCLTTEVLPHVSVDYVSYSAYDAQQNAATNLPAALDFIEKHLPAKPELSGKRVWIGEFGFKAKSHSPAAQQARSLEFAELAIQWGCPFVLHWQLYDNEFKDGAYNGFWLINDKGEEQPLFHALTDYFNAGRRAVASSVQQTGQVPDADSYRQQAQEWLPAANAPQ